MSVKATKNSALIDPFTEWAHKTGRIFILVFTAYMVGMPFVICTIFDCMPSFSMCIPGLVTILTIMFPMSIAEIGSYTPILGSSSYLTFASGNLMNMKMPCIINAQRIAKVEQFPTALPSLSWLWVWFCWYSSSPCWLTPLSQPQVTICCPLCSAP